MPRKVSWARIHLSPGKDTPLALCGITSTYTSTLFDWRSAVDKADYLEACLKFALAHPDQVKAFLLSAISDAEDAYVMYSL